MAGLQDIPFRIPSKWDPAWYAQHLREVLALADVRNAIQGQGIQISGQSNEPATISTSEDLQQLLLQTFVLATPSGFLTHERVLAGEAGVVSITDGGDNADITVSIDEHSLTLSKLHELAAFGVLGNPVDGTGQVQNINPTADKAVLALTGTTITFDPIDSSYVSDFVEAAQDAVGTIFVDSTSINFTYTDATPAITAVVDQSLTFLTVDDETAALAGAVQLVAGTNVSLDDSTPGQLIVNAAAGASLAFAQTTVDAGDTVANDSAETDFFNVYPIPGGTLSAEGEVAEVRYYGLISTDGGAAPTIRFRVKLGSTVMLDSGAITTVTGLSDVGWMLDATLITTHTANEVEAQGQLRIPGLDLIPMANTAPVSVTLSTDQTLTLSVEWGTADADNSITLRATTVRIDLAATNSSDVVLPLVRTDILQERTNGAASSSFTPPDNSLLVAVLGVCQASGASDPSGDLGISGGSLTWTPQINDGSAISYSRGVRIFTAPVSTGASMTVTPTLGGGRSIFTLDLHLFAYENYDTGSPVGATASSHTEPSGSGPQTLTLSGAPASSSEVLAVMHTNPTGSGPINPDTGWSERYDNVATNIEMQTQTRAGSTSTSVSWAGVGSTFNNENVAAAIEIKRA